jgi:hypothetical protein
MGPGTERTPQTKPCEGGENGGGIAYGLGGEKMFFALLMVLISGILLLLSAYQKEGKP